MNNQIEIVEHMEMPTPCERCGDWFDLHDGKSSADGKIQICNNCSDNEKQQVYVLELDGVKYLSTDIDDISESIKSELEFGDKDNVFKVYSQEITQKEINELPEFDGF